MAKKEALPQPEEKQEVAKYEPTDREREARAALRTAIRSKLPAPTVKVTGNKWEVDHPDYMTGLVQLSSSMGTTSFIFAHGIVGQLINAVSHGKEIDQSSVNFALAVIDGIKPKDELETMLAAQMAAVHAAVMTQARRMAHAETIPQQDSNERALNKLARTFTTQMETLKRYRTGGEQKVTVHHVTVNEGGQAIVGTVEQAKGRGEG